MKKYLLIFSLIILSGCAVTQSTGLTESDPTVTTQRESIKKEFDSIPPPSSGRPISVAVYSFADKTGQRRPQQNIASLSTAITQGAETFLIKALAEVGQGKWFEVVERVGLDNLTKERTIIRQMRELYEGNGAKPLMPMLFAGMIIEGGIVGYDSSINSGGIGQRILGIGKQTQWSQDVVTVSLRAVSVNTGKVLVSVTVQKTILSSADSLTAFKFFDMGTKAFEAEAGLTINEPGTYAVKSATEAAVVELIKEGQRKGVWQFKQDDTVKSETPPISHTPVQSDRGLSSVKTEEVKNELVQKTPAPEVPQPPTPAPQQSDGGTVDGRDQEKTDSGKQDKTNKTEVKPEVKKAQTPQMIPSHIKNPGTITDWVNLRETPLKDSRRLTRLEPGTVVEIIKQEESQMKIKVDGKVGWVAAMFIKKESKIKLSR